MLEDYRRKAMDLGLSQVVFRGFITGEEFEKELSGAAYAVVPSECYETFSYAAQEPMARGIPVVASDVGALPELVKEGETGLLFPSGDAEALSDRVGRMWNDPALRTRLGAQAKEFVRKRCDSKQYLEDLLGLYGEVSSTRANGHRIRKTR